MRSRVVPGLAGAGIALLVLIVACAVFGAIAGVTIYGDEYGRHYGFAGAFLGVVHFGLLGCIPAALLGFAVGAIVRPRRGGAAPPGPAARR